MPAKVELIPSLPGLSPVGSKPVTARFDGYGVHTIYLRQ